MTEKRIGSWNIQDAAPGRPVLLRAVAGGEHKEVFSHRIQIAAKQNTALEGEADARHGIGQVGCVFFVSIVRQLIGSRVLDRKKTHLYFLTRLDSGVRSFESESPMPASAISLEPALM